MTIRLELDPELETQLSAGARARGMEIEQYAQRLLQDALTAGAAGRSRASQQEFRTCLDALAGKAPPQLSGETFSRETIYSEHD